MKKRLMYLYMRARPYTYTYYAAAYDRGMTQKQMVSQKNELRNPRRMNNSCRPRIDAKSNPDKIYT